MHRYNLRYVIHEPSEETGQMYMAEIPALPGCRAWAATPDEVIDYLQSVAEQFISSYLEHGDELPQEVVASRLDGERILVSV